jgi:hypothetical protein
MRILFVTPGVFTDAGGFAIYFGSDGKLHVKRVPGWDPAVRELAAAVQVLDAAATMKDAHAAQKFVDFAENILNTRSGALGQHLEVPQK